MNSSEPMQENNAGSLEALLFIHGEPISKETIGQKLSLTQEEVAAAIAELDFHLQAPEAGLQLVTDGAHIQLVTKPVYASILSTLLQDEFSDDLTPAVVETLSVVAYCGPVSRSQIEQIRGVNCALSLRTVLVRGLVDKIPDPRHPSRVLYQASFQLLSHLGLQHASQLPEFETFSALLKKSSMAKPPEHSS